MAERSATAPQVLPSSSAAAPTVFCEAGRHFAAPSRSGGYAELHCVSNFSFLRGASHPQELVEQAAALGYAAIAITDEHSLAGIVRAHLAARERSIKLIVGAEITPQDALPLVLLATDRPSYGRLCRLITCGRLRMPKGRCMLTLADVAAHSAGLIALVLPPLPGIPVPCHNPAAARAGTDNNLQTIEAGLLACREIFNDRLYLAAELTRQLPDAVALEWFGELSRRSRIPVVAANGVHYHVPQRRYLQDVLTCIREHCALAEAGSRLFSNAERHLRSPEEFARRYASMPAAVSRTLEIADRCRFSLDELRYDYPHELCPEGLPPLEYLRRLTWEGAARRYPAGIPPSVRDQLERELALIGALGYEHYFLTVWDLVRFAQQRGILCQGRGSAANSAICYVLGITAVDPARASICCSSGSSRPSATSRPTSTSISSTSGARRSSNGSTRPTAATTRPSPPR
jgi:error-prone DNA polymerase